MSYNSIPNNTALATLYKTKKGHTLITIHFNFKIINIIVYSLKHITYTFYKYFLSMVDYFNYLFYSEIVILFFKERCSKK